MKIDNSVKGTASTVSHGGVRRSANEPAQGSTAGAADASTQVQISSLSALGVDSVLANTSVTNPDKIAEIKLAIANGQFTVNADKIASGLLDSVRQMLGNRSSGT